jgi:heme/copper-type cytochrome/quinol oxidase subunit 2
MSMTERVTRPSRGQMARWFLPFVGAAIVVMVWPATVAGATVVHHIDLDSHQYAFVPGRIAVKAGDRVEINLTASDVVHGFYLDGYGLETRVEPGISRQITFVAGQPGKFRYRCSVSCGPLHPFMIGELVVTPNAPFWKAAAAVMIALSGMLVYLWKMGMERET